MNRGRDPEIDLLARRESGPWKRRYVFAATAIVGGVLVGPVLTVGYAVREFGTVPRGTLVRSPGEATFTVTAADEYTAWLETRGFSTGGYREWDGVRRRDVKLILDTGPETSVIKSQPTEPLGIGLIWIQRHTLATYQLSPGTYRIRSESPAEALVVVGPSQRDSVLKLVAMQILTFGGIAVAFVGLLALPIIGALHWRSRRAREAG
jgi:hypothetical protein